MDLCNYNKNIISLYASKILQIPGLDKNQSASGNYIIFRYGSIDFWIPDRWIWIWDLQKSVEYKLSEDCIGRKSKFYLKMYWQREGKEW